jgi:LysM repeat protein
MSSMNSSLTPQNNNKICPYLGLTSDLLTAMDYPSLQNFCHHASPLASPGAAHQRQFCLESSYVQCELYAAKSAKGMPASFLAEPVTTRKQSPKLRWLLLVLILLLLIGAGLWFAFARALISIPTPAAAVHISPVFTWTVKPSATIAPTSTATLVPSLTVTPSLTVPTRTGTLYTATVRKPSPTATSSSTRTPLPSATVTPSATRTSLPSATATKTATVTTTATRASSLQPMHLFKTPFGVERQFQLHKVLEGENLSWIAANYQTSVDAIRAINYMMTDRLWASSVIVVPVKTMDVKGVLPMTPYLISTDGITAQDLALEQGINLAAFCELNQLTSNYLFQVGEWVIMPRTPPTP